MIWKHKKYINLKKKNLKIQNFSKIFLKYKNKHAQKPVWNSQI
jgi:hypothetical protein